MSEQDPQEQRCSACGGTYDIRPTSPWHQPQLICNPCFMVWYETGITDPAELGRESLRLKALNEFPWNRYLSEAKP